MVEALQLLNEHMKTCCINILWQSIVSKPMRGYRSLCAHWWLCLHFPCEVLAGPYVLNPIFRLILYFFKPESFYVSSEYTWYKVNI